MTDEIWENPIVLHPVADLTRDVPLSVDTRRGMVLKYYIQGLTAQQILEKLAEDNVKLPDTYSANSVYGDIEMEMVRVRRENSRTLVDAINLEVMRLDQLFSVMYELGMAGDVKAADEARKIIIDRSNLLGLNKVDKSKVSDWRTKVVELLESGKITIEELKKELGDELTGEIVALRGYRRDKDSSPDVIDGVATEVAGQTHS